MSLTLCLIVKDEEKNLERCIKSYAGIYDQLVIVDTGSQDKTKEIAKNLAADIFDFTWNDDFSEARNFALSKVKTTWTIMVDADDIMKTEDRDVLRTKIPSLSLEIAGVILPYLLPSAYTGYVKSYKPRIWRTSFGFRYHLPVHEYLDAPAHILQTFIRIETPVYHSASPSEFSKSFPRNIRILEKAIRKQPQETRLLFYLGHDNHFSGNYGQAISWYQKFIDAKPKSMDELNRVLFWKGYCHLTLGQTDSAKDCFKRAIEAHGSFIEPYLYLGDILLQQKKITKALEYYLLAMNCQIPQTHVFFQPAFYQGVAEKKIELALSAMQSNTI
jgi:glycosyltransferase involved in cell wall biosynthesis